MMEYSNKHHKDTDELLFPCSQYMICPGNEVSYVDLLSPVNKVEYVDLDETFEDNPFKSM